MPTNEDEWSTFLFHINIFVFASCSLLQLVLSGPVLYYNNIHTPPLAFSPHASHSPIASHPTHTPHPPLASSHPQYPAQPFMTGMQFPFRPSHWKKCQTGLQMWSPVCVRMRFCCAWINECMCEWCLCVIMLTSRYASANSLWGWHVCQ